MKCLILDFIDDKQQATIPGPGNYNSTTTNMIGKNLVSKYKSTVLGGSLMNKSKRFAISQSNFKIIQQKLRLFGITKQISKLI